MTYEEAIKWIKHDLGFTATEDYFKAHHMAIEALEKQIPMKKHKYMGYRCICGEQVAKNQRYCEYCGQKLLDWSEEDEN